MEAGGGVKGGGWELKRERVESSGQLSKPPTSRTPVPPPGTGSIGQ